MLASKKKARWLNRHGECWRTCAQPSSNWVHVMLKTGKGTGNAKQWREGTQNKSQTKSQLKRRCDSNLVLKSCAGALAEPLAHIFNSSLESGKYPSQRKRGVIKLLYKHKRDRSNPAYIGLLPSYLVFPRYLKDVYESSYNITFWEITPCRPNSLVSSQDIGCVAAFGSRGQLA